jgi:superfamily I DNA and/or RNA helicase
MSGIDKLEISIDDYDYLLIDEACQAVELSTLIPFGLNPKRVIMVGDEQQLPATTFAENSSKTKYDRSLFERLMNNGYQKEVLRT